MRRSSTQLVGLGAFASTLLTVGSSATAHAREARPVVTLSCELEGGHRHIRPSQLAEGVDDELQCRAVLHGAAPGKALAGELVLAVRGGPPRTVAAGRFSADDALPGALIVEDLKVPHATWVSAVRWTKQRRPYLQLVLRVSAEQAPGRRWPVVLEKTFRIDDRPPPALVAAARRRR